MIHRVNRFYKNCLPFRQQYGNVQGLNLALQIRRAQNNEAKTASVRIPGLKSPVHIRPRTVDARVLQEIFGTQPFNIKIGTSPKFIIDAGAHIGLSSLFFANRFPTATVISLELEANNYRMLQKNTAHEPRVHPLHCGLWSVDGTLSVANESAETWAYYAAESSDNEHDCITTPSLSVASLMKRYNIPTIDLLKLDIEGAEKEVLSTADQWIEKVKTIAVEVHDWLKPGCSDALESAIKGRCFNRTQVGDYIILQNTFEDFSSEHSN